MRVRTCQCWFFDSKPERKGVAICMCRSSVIEEVAHEPDEVLLSCQGQGVVVRRLGVTSVLAKTASGGERHLGTQ